MRIASTESKLLHGVINADTIVVERRQTSADDLWGFFVERHSLASQRPDRRGETALLSMLASIATRFCPSCADRAEEDDVLERSARNSVESAQAMVAASSLAHNMWELEQSYLAPSTPPPSTGNERSLLTIAKPASPLGRQHLRPLSADKVRAENTLLEDASTRRSIVARKRASSSSGSPLASSTARRGQQLAITPPPPEDPCAGPCVPVLLIGGKTCAEETPTRPPTPLSRRSSVVVPTGGGVSGEAMP